MNVDLTIDEIKHINGSLRFCLGAYKEMLDDGSLVDSIHFESVEQLLEHAQDSAQFENTLRALISKFAPLIPKA